MRDTQVRARLSIQNRPHCRKIGITRGATTVLKLSFDNKVYSFEDAKQVTFMFKQGDDIQKFTAIDYAVASDSQAWSFDKHFSYDEVTDCLVFTLAADETISLFEATEKHDLLVTFEIAIELNANVADLNGAVIIEKQAPLYVVDSLYSQVADVEANDPATASTIVSNSLFCSNDLLCK